jgi:hypothetical protein
LLPLRVRAKQVDEPHPGLQTVVHVVRLRRQLLAAEPADAAAHACQLCIIKLSMAQKPSTLLGLSVLLWTEQAAEAELIKNKGVVINVSSGVALAAAPAAAMAPYFIAKASQVRRLRFQGSRRHWHMA